MKLNINLEGPDYTTNLLLFEEHTLRLSSNNSSQPESPPPPFPPPQRSVLTTPVRGKNNKAKTRTGQDGRRRTPADKTSQPQSHGDRCVWRSVLPVFLWKARHCLINAGLSIGGATQCGHRHRRCVYRRHRDRLFWTPVWTDVAGFLHPGQLSRWLFRYEDALGGGHLVGVHHHHSG